MTLSPWLRLGRVSNLPTVWSNALAGLALADALDTLRAATLAAAFSVFYVGGMFLNDAFDRHIDARERPGRPIPSGQVSARAVFAAGFGALAAGTLLLVALASAWGAPTGPALASGAGLAALIVFYDVYHKQNPLSPLVMGACRVMLYVAAAATAGQSIQVPLLLGALALWCHLIGLTYAAKREASNRLTRAWPLAFLAAPVLYGAVLAWEAPLAWPFLAAHGGWAAYALSFLRSGQRRSVPGAVVRWIAGISLLDALLIAATGSVAWAVIAALGCALTRALQRYVPGT